MGLEPGYNVNEHVRLVRHLGRGGMGSVWVARHEKLALDVAVKFVAADLLKADDPLVLSRFKREAQLAAKLDNPHTVRILDHGVSKEGGPYIVMELLEGQSIADKLRVEKRIKVSEAVDIVDQIAVGLTHAHALGIVHRDIKPPNLFLAKPRAGRELVKIVDFGIAKTSQPTESDSMATSSGVLIGTPQYMSPEQLMRAAPADASADLWALAVVAYEMVTGRLPFMGETLAATLVAITRADVVPPTKTVPGLAGALDVFFRRALSVEPSRRYANATGFASAFREAAAGTASEDLPTLAGVEPVSADATLPTAEFLLRQKVTPATPPVTSGAPVGPARSVFPAGVTGELGYAATEPGTPVARVEKPGPAPSRQSRAPLVIGAVALGAIGLAFYAMWAAGPTASAPPTPNTSAIAIASVTASATESAPLASAPSSVPPPPKLGVIANLTVPAGIAPLTSMFVPGFSVAREEGDGDATFNNAVGACERRRMALCTESQWLRACDIEPALGREPSWTMTGTESAIALRGGAGCSSRGEAFADSKAPERIGVCCSRAVSVRSSNTHMAFLTTTSGKLLNIERTVNAANGLELAAMSLPELNLFGKLMGKEEIVSTTAWIGRSGTFYFDSCDVALSDVGVDRRWTANCTGILKTSKDTRRAFRWITIADGGQLAELREPKVTTSVSTPPPAKTP
jgi:eukaryotic-like serine/threonine-protein kinase